MPQEARSPGTPPREDYHRFDEELFQRGEMHRAPDVAQRVRLALGPAPLDDARYLLPPIPLPSGDVGASGAPSQGPHPGIEFVVDMTGNLPIPLTRFLQAFPLLQRRGLGFVQFWVRRDRRNASWIRLDSDQAEGSVAAIALTWELSGLLSEGTEAIAELAGYVLQAQERAALVGLTAVPRETPESASRRALRLTALRHRFSRAVEMRLMPLGRSFPARQVWRAAYALGLRWGDMDLFHWDDPVRGERLFTLSAVGHPGYFLPERAAEGEGTAGIALSFELPLNPVPVETYERMSVALAYLRQQLNGRPLTRDGAELDTERLDEERDQLAEAVQELARAGVAPGSPDASRFF